MRKLNTRVFTPNPDHIQSTPLAAHLLAFAGYRHPTRRSMMNVLELIAAALDGGSLDDEKAHQLAEDLATHFHRWAQTIEEDAVTQDAGEPQCTTPILAVTPAPVMVCGPAMAAAFDASGELRRAGRLVVGPPPEQRYLVTWSIDIEAGTRREAAMAAKRIQQRPDSTANVFEVMDDRGESVSIDLDEEHER